MKRVVWFDPGGRVVHAEASRDDHEVLTTCGARYPVTQVKEVDGPFYGRPDCARCFPSAGDQS